MSKSDDTEVIVNRTTMIVASRLLSLAACAGGAREGPVDDAAAGFEGESGGPCTSDLAECDEQELEEGADPVMPPE